MECQLSEDKKISLRSSVNAPTKKLRICCAPRALAEAKYGLFVGKQSFLQV